MPVVLITGASQGLGHALSVHLARLGWTVVADARDATALDAAGADLSGSDHVLIPGDVTDPAHRAELVAAVVHLGGPDLLVNNASTLGASPLPRFTDLDPATYLRVLQVNVVAPMALVTALLPGLRDHRATVVNISSDAAVEAYEGWGAYGSAKAALDHAGRILATEEPALRVLSVDPGDMRTGMHQSAFPDEDISDRPLPEEVAPRLARLLLEGSAQGRHQLLAEVSG